ncbi:MAG: response regulator [Synergistaceae bacterium]|jgi:two-component system response regulator|nr:response regulator [Synergistaceae bacterium]
MDTDAVVDILLVEDNPCDAELIIRALRKQNIANSITVVEDGAQALDFVFCRGDFSNRSFDAPPKVILLDLKLPKVDGLEVLRQIKSDERTRSIPAVIVTSSEEDPDIKTAYALGVNSYVVKPIGAEDFVKAVSRLGLYWLLVNRHP